MSRSGYSDDYDGDNWQLIQHRGAVESALTGKNGKAFLQEMKDALEALPEKRLIKNSFEHEGEVCALGSVCKTRGVVVDDLTDPEDFFGCAEIIAYRLGIPRSLAAEIMYINDEYYAPRYDHDAKQWIDKTPEERYRWVMAWVDEQLARQRTPRKPRKHRVKKS